MRRTEEENGALTVKVASVAVWEAIVEQVLKLNDGNFQIQQI